jgi:hypothetical protein
MPPTPLPADHWDSSHRSPPGLLPGPGTAGIRSGTKSTCGQAVQARKQVGRHLVCCDSLRHDRAGPQVCALAPLPGNNCLVIMQTVDIQRVFGCTHCSSASAAPRVLHSSPPAAAAVPPLLPAGGTELGPASAGGEESTGLSRQLHSRPQDHQHEVDPTIQGLPSADELATTLWRCLNLSVSAGTDMVQYCMPGPP